MATVYLAQDLKHDRPVALKVLHQELAALLGPERFQREIKLAARLQHPHILTVHDSGEAAGQLWFTMPYVEGQSLRDRLSREKQLPVEDAVRITREAALALEYAHQHGVIHRDIKPENILLTRDGSTLVADFGIARAISAPGEQLTQTGMAVGTPAYMSPEQATGEKELDARSDVYALGCVLYEMLAGEPAYTGPTPQAVLMRAMTERPRPLHATRAAVPAALDAVIARALALTPADRFPTMAALAQSLGPTGQTAAAMPTARSMGSAARPGNGTTRQPNILLRRPLFTMLALGVLIGVGALFAWRQSHGGTDEGGVKRLAVLPFENQGGPDDEYFADGVSDQIRGKLAALPGLEVIARGSSTLYKKSPKTQQEIAQELGVRYLLTAVVRWEKRADGQSTVHVSPELVEVRGGAAPVSRWQQIFDAPLTNVFEVQGDIAGRVARALDLALGDSVREHLAEKPTRNLAAYDAYLRGEALSSSIGVTDPGTLRRAAEEYARAVALDSTFVPAWAQLSRAHSAIYYNSGAMLPEGEAARAAAERALSLSPDSPEGHLAMGDYRALVSGDNTQAIAQYQLGQRVAPRNADLLTGLALAEQGLGKWDLALSNLREARLLDPRSARTARRLCVTLLWLRRYPEANDASDRALELGPDRPDLIEAKAMIRLGQGDLAGAKAVLLDAERKLDPAVLAIFVANYWDLFWLLDDDQQRLLLRQTPAAFDDNRSPWALAIAETYHVRGDLARARAYADSARLSLEEQLRATPNDPQLRGLLGVALALMGRRADAIAEGERSVALQPIHADGYNGPYNEHLLVRTYLLVGETDKALDRLEGLLKVPYFLSAGWLRVDPTFDSLRKNPRFQRLVAGT